MNQWKHSFARDNSRMTTSDLHKLTQRWKCVPSKTHGRTIRVNIHDVRTVLSYVLQNRLVLTTGSKYWASWECLDNHFFPWIKAGCVNWFELLLVNTSYHRPGDRCKWYHILHVFCIKSYVRSLIIERAFMAKACPLHFGQKDPSDELYGIYPLLFYT